MLEELVEGAMPQAFPGTLTLACSCEPAAQADGELTGADLMAAVEWLNEHSRHGARSIRLDIPAGTDTTVRMPL